MKIFFVDGQPILWAGTEASFEVVVQAQAKMHAQIVDGTIKLEVRGEQTYDGRDGLPAMIAVQGEVGILRIEGSLIDGEANWLRYFGVVGYADIVAAAERLYGNPDVKRVLVHIESPGGMVSGIMDAGSRLSKLSSTKKSMVYTGNLAASGGYWLATSIKGEIIAGPTAQVGSIGVVSVHTDTSKMYEDAGIKRTVLRSGENKARVNSIEPLTPELKSAEEAKMADVHNIFRAQVAKGRPNLSTEDLLSVTDGSTFLGKRAKTAGLVDHVATFEQALKLLDTNNPSGNTSPKSKGASMLTEQLIAQLLAGATPQQLGLTEEQTAAWTQMQADAAAAGADDKSGQDGDAAPAPAAAAPAPAAPAADATALQAQVALLNTQLAEANEKLIAKTAEVQNLTAAAAPLQANIEALLGVARKHVGKLQVALGATNTADSMDVAAVLAANTSLTEKFEKNFPIGGVSQQVKAPAPAKETLPRGFTHAVKAAPSANSR